MPASGDLDRLVDDVWSRIAGGINGRWPPWGLPVLATQGKEGPSARVLAGPVENLSVSGSRPVSMTMLSSKVSPSVRS